MKANNRIKTHNQLNYTGSLLAVISISLKPSRDALSLYGGQFWNMMLMMFSIYFNNINTNEIPGALSCVNMISSRVKITCYFTRENNMLFSQVKIFPLLWFNSPLDLLRYDRNIIGSFSEIFFYLRKFSENVRKVFRNVRKIVKNFVINMFIIINRILHARLWIRILSSSVQFNISRVSAANE